MIDIKCTVTVSSEQTSGIYKLAEMASEFSQMLTVKTTADNELGTLYSGKTLKAGNITYSLVKENSSDLLFSVMNEGEDNVKLYISDTLVKQGAALSGENLSSGRNMLVSSGGTANSTTVNSGGYLEVSSGGTANKTMLNSKGNLRISSGGTATSTFIREGQWSSRVEACQGAVFLNTVIGNNGVMEVSSGAVVRDTTVQSGGTFCVSYEAEADKNTVSSGGLMYIKGDTVICDTTVWSGGRLELYSQSLTKGPFRIEDGAVVSAYAGAVIDFTVAEQTDSSTALVNDWSRISGGTDVSYTLTVSTTQGTGDYLLAGGAENFNQTISVKDTDGTAITDLTVGNSFTDNGKTYTLTKNEGDLVLNISLETVVSPSYTEATTAGGGSNTRIEDATATKSYIGGQLLDTEKTDITGSYVVELSGGSFSKTIAGGDAVKTSNNITRTGDIALTVEGGTFGQRVAGGMYYCPADNSSAGSVTLEGNVNLALKGGTFNGRIYGGCNAKNDALGDNTRINGNVNLTVDASTNVNINEHLVAGSRGNGNITGSVTVTFTGDAGNGDSCKLKFASGSVVFGGCNGDTTKIDDKGVKTTVSAVAGDRKLVFSAFTGDFDAEVRLFKTAVFESNTQVNFTDENLNLWAVEEWNFEYGCGITGFGKNEFEDDVLNFDLGSWDGTTDWTVITGKSDGLSDLAEASAVNFGGSAAHWESGGWTDGNYLLSISAVDETTSSMILAKLN